MVQHWIRHDKLVEAVNAKLVRIPNQPRFYAERGAVGDLKIRLAKLTTAKWVDRDVALRAIRSAIANADIYTGDATVLNNVSSRLVDIETAVTALPLRTALLGQPGERAPM